MTQPTMYREYNLSPRSSPGFIRETNLDNVTLNAGAFVPIWSRQVNRDERLFWGFGPMNRDAADASFIDFDLQADGTGTGSPGDAINGTLRVAIVDSTGDDKRRRVIGDLGSLADTLSEARRDKPMAPELGPKAGPDRYLELQVKAESGSDGVVVDNSGSNGSVLFPYGSFTGV